MNLDSDEILALKAERDMLRNDLAQLAGMVNRAHRRARRWRVDSTHLTKEAADYVRLRGINAAPQATGKHRFTTDHYIALLGGVSASEIGRQIGLSGQMVVNHALKRSIIMCPELRLRANYKPLENLRENAELLIAMARKLQPGKKDGG